jgi:hypothetical protein
MDRRGFELTYVQRACDSSERGAADGRLEAMASARGPLLTMSLSASDLAHLAVALILLLAASHGCGYLCRRWRQPVVIGEVIGGLLLGPTVLQRLLPGVQQWIFSDNLPTGHGARRDLPARAPAPDVQLRRRDPQPVPPG